MSEQDERGEDLVERGTDPGSVWPPAGATTNKAAERARAASFAEYTKESTGHGQGEGTAPGAGRFPRSDVGGRH